MNKKEVHIKNKLRTTVFNRSAAKLLYVKLAFSSVLSRLFAGFRENYLRRSRLYRSPVMVKLPAVLCIQAIARVNQNLPESLLTPAPLISINE